MPLFTCQLARSSPPQQVVARHPRLGELRLVLKSFPPLLVMYLFFTVAGILVGKPIFRIPYAMLVPLYLCVIVSVFVQERQWKRLEALRQAAAQEDYRLRADRQPQPNPWALRVPVEIAFRFSMRLYLMAVLLTLVLMGTGLLPLALSSPYSDPSSFPWLWIIVLSSGLIALLLALLGRQRQMVEVGPEGIRSWTRSMGTTQRMSTVYWREARLFACYRRPDSWGKSSEMIYELSSAAQVVQWTWAQKVSLRGSIPILPFGEHQAQMHALSELIAARTGLPLYDLSKAQASQREAPVSSEAGGYHGNNERIG